MNEAAPEKRVETLKVDLWTGRQKRTETRVNGANVPAGEAQSNPENHPRMEGVVERQNEGRRERTRMKTAETTEEVSSDGMEKRVKRLKGQRSARFASDKLRAD
ncbi:MAG: hypothetical protein ACLQAH_10135 [Limisphaerales bacterium]